MSVAPFPLHEKIAQLEAIERYFQEPEMNLEEAIKKHKEALALAKEILEYLKKAENSLKEISMKEILAANDHCEPADREEEPAADASEVSV